MSKAGCMRDGRPLWSRSALRSLLVWKEGKVLLFLRPPGHLRTAHRHKSAFGCTTSLPPRTHINACRQFTLGPHVRWELFSRRWYHLQSFSWPTMQTALSFLLPTFWLSSSCTGSFLCKSWNPSEGLSEQQNHLPLIPPRLQNKLPTCVIPLPLLIHYWLMPIESKCLFSFLNAPCPLSSSFPTPACFSVCEWLKSLLFWAQISWVLDIPSWVARWVRPLTAETLSSMGMWLHWNSVTLAPPRL